MNATDLAPGLVEGTPLENTFMLARTDSDAAPRPFVVPAATGAGIVAMSIFKGMTYPILPWFDAAAVETVVDVGANVGAASAWFRLHYPSARVVAFEPHPEAFAFLARNAETFGFEARPYGLWRSACKATLRDGVPECGTVTASLCENRTNTENLIPIELRAAWGELDALGAIDILKIDTEGAEWPILSMTPRVWMTPILYLEIHSEEDRLLIDKFLAPTHILYSGTIYAPHKAEFVYVRRAILPAEYELQAFRLPAEM